MDGDSTLEERQAFDTVELSMEQNGMTTWALVAVLLAIGGGFLGTAVPSLGPLAALALVLGLVTAIVSIALASRAR